jgi:muconolactone delta-isomerase
MKFLVVSKRTAPPPPEAWLDLTDASAAWADQYMRSGELEAAWSIAGGGGMAGVVTVESLEALEAIMVEFPWAPFSDIEVHPLVDLQTSTERLRYAIEAMSKTMRPALEPISDCEAQCIKDHPNDTQKRLNCMLKCVADGKVAVGRVIALR